MPVLRTKRRKTFTVIDNEVLQSKELSLKATGLLCFLLSKPDGWRVNSSNLAREKKDGRDSIRSAMNELSEAGYVAGKREQTDDGKFASIIYVYESPDLNPFFGKKQTKTTKLFGKRPQKKKVNSK